MATEISPALAEVINVLDQARIPDKLHCPHCDGFLLNSYKLPCCEQSICETCHAKLSDRCCICEHQPFSQELCKPNVGLRRTAKAFLKTQEKKLADEQAKSQAAIEPAEKATAGGREHEAINGAPSTEPVHMDIASLSGEAPPADDTQTSIAAIHDSAPVDATTANVPEPRSVEDANPAEALALTERTENLSMTQDVDREEATGDAEASSKDDANNVGGGMNFNGFPNMLSMNAGVNIMDPTQMMQYMTTNGMNGFNTMMGMSNMGMNQMPQGMFGGFGGPGMGMNGMNGMNMGMNFNANAGMYGAGWNGQNNNMWNGPQNNNPIAFSNGIGGDFGSNSGYGYNMSQSPNFHQQQPPNGDFGYYGRGPGRGRGRGRGGFNRNRNSFNNFSGANQPHFQNAHEQQQYEIQNMQAQMVNDQGPNDGPKADDSLMETSEPPAVDDDEFAPGGQEEVQEALGADYHRSQVEESEDQDKSGDPNVAESIEAHPTATPQEAADKTGPIVDGKADFAEAAAAQSPTTYDDAKAIPQQSSDAKASPEESTKSMPPPTAPSGTPGQPRELEEDYGFRARGHSKFPSRSRGSFIGINGSPVSPMRAAPQPAAVSPDSKGVGVIGAPTGPRAMREPQARPARPISGSQSNNGGFKIMGRASMTSQDSEPRPSHRSRSPLSAVGEGNHEPEARSDSRHGSRHSAQGRSRKDVEPVDEYDRDYDYDHKRSRKSRRDDENDYEMQNADRPRSRSRTPTERKSSHRSHRDKDHRSSRSKHQSSRSHRPTNGEKDHDTDDYGVSAHSSRDVAESESRSGHRGHRSSKSSKYEERDRDRDREDRHRDRKRSRHDRDYEDAMDDDDSSRHRSRRHKREHRDESAANGQGASSRSHRSSEAATPVEAEREKDKHQDPYALEREKMIAARVAKEEQRREKASREDRRSGGGSGRLAGGRRVSYKHEDDVQRSMLETERESARWR